MKVLYIYAHPQVTSFNAHLKAIALNVFTTQSLSFKVSDLYAEHFNAVASWEDFLDDNCEQQYFAAQYKAFKSHHLAMDIEKEMQKLKWATHIIFQFPLWWFSMPAILKGWFDRVLVKGFAYDAGKIFHEGLLVGKKAALVISTQSGESAYQLSGLHQSDIHQFLHPIHHTLRFVGIEPMPSFVTYDAYHLEQNRQLEIENKYKKYLKSFLE